MYMAGLYTSPMDTFLSERTIRGDELGRCLLLAINGKVGMTML